MIIHNTNKFKTTIITVRFKEEINKENLGFRALLPSIMSTVTPTYRTRQALNQALKSLYGASISARTLKVGKLSLVEFSLSMIDPSLMDEGFFEDGLKILHEIIYGHKNLPKKEFELVKRLTIEKLETAKNNKTTVALRDMVEIMFKDERYSLRTSGTPEIINDVTYDSLNRYYKKVIKENDVDVSINGNLDESTIDLVDKYFSKKDNHSHYPIDDEVHNVSLIKEIINYDDINQAKLNIGYDFPIRFDDEDHYAAMLFNIVFGGGSHSRLFLNVREKHSLCYYISSNYVAYKGFIYVYTGIDKKNVELAKDLINKELQDLQTNLVTKEELDISKKGLINQIKEQEDSQTTMNGVIYREYLLNKNETLKDKIENINKVTSHEILKVAQKVRLDTIYVLSPEEES